MCADKSDSNLAENYSFVWTFGEVEKTAGGLEKGYREFIGLMTAEKPVLILLDAIVSLLHQIVNLIVVQLVDGRILKFSVCLISELDRFCWFILSLDLGRVWLNVPHSFSCRFILIGSQIHVVLSMVFAIFCFDLIILRR